jgi:hypothetical protein
LSVSKIKSALKGRRFQDIEAIKKMWQRRWGLFDIEVPKIFPTAAAALG